ncbi:hypothetical protein MPTK1_3g24530 [Marchantia polymorpha subsp. ruderalis]|uniref:Uncharacterized protein n=2 Tax=Marchantia polymorpha TaxID=3197 RepID=A0AAF6B4D5_MARPO|nr:hypothetical protein MARPO_0178s0001 [Marchantia polymorpha]BBN06869.1 hypothetical protein Mp_3g24530 [Marchantia polymorpha subsp. ruderalis]|eukprot:PTQ27947.1 hypothetical protein MARPO_0178s0001 [Marchantia polymorpha]
MDGRMLDAHTDTRDVWDFPWDALICNEDEDAKTPSGKDWEYLIPGFDDITDNDLSQYLIDSEETPYLDLKTSIQTSQAPDDTSWRLKKRRALFSEQGSVNSLGTETTYQSWDSGSSTGPDPNSSQYMPDPAVWPLLATSETLSYIAPACRILRESYCERGWTNSVLRCDDFADVEFYNWIGDTLPEGPPYGKMVGSDMASYDLPTSHVSTVSLQHQITEVNYEKSLVTVSPKTPVPCLKGTSTAEAQQAEKSRQHITSSYKSTSASTIYCQPFSILKPEGYSLQKINQTLKKTPPQSGQSQPSGAEYDPQYSLGREPGTSISGKPVLAYTKLVTEGQGTLTILRTANK